MVCVRVSLLLKCNVGVLFGVLRDPRSYFPFFLARYGSAIMLQVLYLYIRHYVSVSPNLFEFILCAPTRIVVCFLLCFEALICRVLCSVFNLCSLWHSYGRVLMSYHSVKHTILVIVFFYALFSSVNSLSCLN
jgi:hypothetical protein